MDKIFPLGILRLILGKLLQDASFPVMVIPTMKLCESQVSSQCVWRHYYVPCVVRILINMCVYVPIILAFPHEHYAAVKLEQ